MTLNCILCSCHYKVSSAVIFKVISPCRFVPSALTITVTCAVAIKNESRKRPSNEAIKCIKRCVAYMFMSSHMSLQ